MNLKEQEQRVKEFSARLHELNERSAKMYSDDKRHLMIVAVILLAVAVMVIVRLGFANELLIT